MPDSRLFIPATDLLAHPGHAQPCLKVRQNRWHPAGEALCLHGVLPGTAATKLHGLFLISYFLHTLICSIRKGPLPEGPAPHQLGCAGTDREILQRCICWKEEENGDEEWANLPALHWDVPAHISDLPLQLQCVSSIGPTILSSKYIDLHYLVPKKKLPFFAKQSEF